MDLPQGNGAPGASQGNGAPEATSASGISLEDVNRAITARLRDYEKKLDSKLGESFSSFEAKLTEALASQQQQKAPEGDKPTAKPDLSIDDHPTVKSLQKQLSEIKNREAKIAAEREEERAKSRDLKLRQKLTEALAEQGIDGTRAKHAIAFLVDGEKRVSIDADEMITFRDANGDALDLQMGLKTWAASEDAKLYLPPRGAVGSGDSNRTTTGPGRLNAQADPIANLTKLVAQKYGMAGG